MVEFLLNIFASITRLLIQRRMVTILVYHNISASLFEQHIDRLARVYSIISFETYIEYRERRLNKLPPFPLIFTFDDGYKENYDLLPLFKRYGIRPTIYLCTYPLNTNRMVWSSCIKDSKSMQANLDINYEEAVESTVCQGFDKDREFDNRTFLNRAELEDMKGVVDFQSHTSSHANLAMASEEILIHELDDSKKALESMGLKVHTICYPFSYYSSATIQAAKKVGYSYGVTVEPYCNSKRTYPFRIKRLSMNGAAPRLVLVKASGLFTFIKEVALQRRGMRKFIEE